MAPSFRICCNNSASTAANELSHQWDVPQVLPIGSKFAEHCIYTILTTNIFKVKLRLLELRSLKLAFVIQPEKRDYPFG